LKNTMNIHHLITTRIASNCIFNSRSMLMSPMILKLISLDNALAI
jgi:hypothetical protein